MLPLHKVLVDGFRRNSLFIMYFWLGMALTSPSIIVQYTFIRSFKLGVVELAELGGLISIAWALKPFIGFGVDRISRVVSRRFQASFCYCFAGLTFSLASFASSLAFFVLLLFLASFFLACADVVQDSSLVRSLQGTSAAERGRVQSCAWAFRSCGSILGCLLSAAFSLHENRFAFVALVHLGGVFSALLLQVHQNTGEKRIVSVRKLCDKNIVLFSIVLFFFAYEPGDGAIFEYQIIQKYKVDAYVLALAQILGFTMVMLASLSFQRCRRFRPVVIVTVTSALGFLSILSRNLFLTNRMQFETNAFYLSNIAFSGFFGHLSFLPLAVISTSLCKPGAEATMYAYFMALTNFAGIISRELSGALAGSLGIRKQLQIDTRLLDIFYGICLGLDFVGLVVVAALMLKVVVKDQSKHIELIEINEEELEELESTDSLEDVDLS